VTTLLLPLMVVATSDVRGAPFQQGVVFAHVLPFAGSSRVFQVGPNPLKLTVPVGTVVRLQLFYSLKNL